MNDKYEKCSVTDLVDPQLPHNNVVHCGGHLPPHVVVPTGVELQVNGTWGGDRGKSSLFVCFKFLLQQFLCCHSTTAGMRAICCRCDCKTCSIQPAKHRVMYLTINISHFKSLLFLLHGTLWQVESQRAVSGKIPLPPLAVPGSMQSITHLSQ